jgi:hypothetical protein
MNRLLLTLIGNRIYNDYNMQILISRFQKSDWPIVYADRRFNIYSDYNFA